MRTRLTPEAGKTHRKSFSTKVKNAQIAEWEKATGQVNMKVCQTNWNTNK